MSRAISGSDIFLDRSARRLSKSAISASMTSGLRGFLMILTRDPPAGSTDLRFDPSAGKDFLFTRREPPATADGSDFPRRVAPGADAADADSVNDSPFSRAAF